MWAPGHVSPLPDQGLGSNGPSALQAQSERASSPLTRPRDAVPRALSSAFLLLLLGHLIPKLWPPLPQGWLPASNLVS